MPVQSGDGASPVKPRPVALSTNGAAFLGAWEGFRDRCYDDSENNCTIGIGHLVHLGPTTLHDLKVWGTITYPHALALAQADVHRTGVAAVQQNVKVRLTQPQTDALLSLCFNAGPGALGPGRSVTEAVNSKPRVWNRKAMSDWHSLVAAAFMYWAHPVELTRRRQSEAFLFGAGKYTKSTGNPYANA